VEPYRIEEGHAVYFMTFTVVKWLPVFVSAETCQIVVDSLNFCRREKSLRINAYVIMPTHLHAILFDADFDALRLAETVTSLRKHTGRKLSDYCTEHLSVFDRILREAAEADRKRQFWQPSRRPEAIYTERFWRQKIEYLHDNPCRKGLVLRPEAWRFSSAAYWLEGATESEVDLEPLVW
jgi:REP element-mobilizing transposase RayT